MPPRMKVEEVLERLANAGIVVSKIQPIDYGQRIEGNSGEIINVFDTGRISIQGENAVAVQAALEQAVSAEKRRKKDRVFVVYGHDENAKLKLVNLLFQLGLNPILVENKAKLGGTIIECLERLITDEIDFGLVLLTPDDEVRKADGSYFQPRPNTILELGMLYGVVKRERVGILWRESQGMVDPSDLKGIFSIRFKESPEEKAQDIIKELKAAGLHLDLERYFAGEKVVSK
jgi:predicted nucleotide-binding protein